MAEHTVLWNALGLHPFRPGEPDSNRTPTDAELLLGEPALRLMLEAYPQAQVVAVGRKAEALLAKLGVRALAVRHPANGGAKAFWHGMAQVAGSSV
jgi:uracil-DNA glycosylase